MRKINLIILLSFLYSCSSTPVKEEEKLTKSELDLELESLKNEDFRPQSQIRYVEAADYHVIGDLVDDALKDETLNKIETPEIKDIKEKMTGVASLCYLGKTSDGMKVLDELYPKYKGNPTYWNQIASCYYKEGNRRKASVFYNKALSLDENYVPAINNLGVIYLDERKYEKAQAAFKKVLELDRRNKTSKYNLANLYIRFGLFEAAKSNLKEILRYDQQDKDVLLSLAYSELYQKNINDGLMYLSKIPQKFMTKTDVSIAVLFAYKLSNNDKYLKVLEFIKAQKLSARERNVVEKIIGAQI